MQEHTLYQKVNVEDVDELNISMKRVVKINDKIECVETKYIDKICVHVNVDNDYYIRSVPNLYHF